MTEIRVPERVRLNAVCSLAEGRDRHGYGPSGDRLFSKLAGGSGRNLVTLEPDELEVIVDYAWTLFNCTADDARWDQDARNDRAAARRFLRHAGEVV